MRINWGIRIIILYSSFVIFMLTMVYKCTLQKYDLVSNDYYEQELKYQQVIDGSKNLEALNEKVAIKTNDAGYSVAVPAAAAENISGNVFFYCPSNAAVDFRQPLTSNSIEVAKDKLHTGVYKVKTTWKANDKQYYDEQTLVVR